jgi:hypothetical protein
MAFSRMAKFGTVVACGAISQYHLPGDAMVISKDSLAEIVRLTSISSLFSNAKVITGPPKLNIPGLRSHYLQRKMAEGIRRNFTMDQGR